MNILTLQLHALPLHACPFDGATVPRPAFASGSVWWDKARIELHGRRILRGGMVGLPEIFAQLEAWRRHLSGRTAELLRQARAIESKQEKKFPYPRFALQKYKPEPEEAKDVPP